MSLLASCYCPEEVGLQMAFVYYFLHIFVHIVHYGMSVLRCDYSHCKKY